jgi:dihydroneopterin aldolase
MTSNRHHALPGRIELRGLRCAGRHGDPPGGVEQLFTVDIDVDIDLEAVADSDAYVDTIDIADLAQTVREVVGGQPRLLIETVAVHTARLVMDRHAGISNLRLRLAKHEPPGLDVAEEAVEVSLNRTPG